MSWGALWRSLLRSLWRGRHPRLCLLVLLIDSLSVVGDALRDAPDPRIG